MSWDTTLPYRPLLRCCVAALLSTLSTQSFANSNLYDFTEEDLFGHIPQIVTATHLSQKLTEAPAAVSIIDQDIIEASGALNIPDLFRLVPGMQVFHVHSNKMGVTYHGVNDDFPSRMEVMINGRSIYIPLLSTVVWESIGISIDDIEHIEIVRGSNVPTHGSNAFLGAINIITKSPISESGASINATLGALNTQNFTARYSNNDSEFAYTLSAGSLKNDGIDFYNDAGQNKFITFSGSITPNLTDTLNLNLGITEGYAYRGEGNDDDIGKANFTPRDHHSNYQDIRWNHILDTQSEIQLHYIRNYLKLSAENYDAKGLANHLGLYTTLANAYPLLTPSQIETEAERLADELIRVNNGMIPRDNERGVLETHEIGFLYTANLSTELDTIIGSNFRYERAKSNTLLQNQDNSWVDETSWQLFGNLEYQATNQATLNVGAMFEDSSITGGSTSFRTALNYSLTNFATIRAAFSHAHRVPSLLEANNSYSVDRSPLSGAPKGTVIDVYTKPFRGMEPEEINTFEIGYFHIWPEYSGQFDLRIFHEDIDDAIMRALKLPANDADGDLNISNNNAAWTNWGFEAQFRYQSPDTHKSSILLNYSFNDSQGSWTRGYYPAGGYPNDIKIDSLDKASPTHTASLLLSTKPTPDSLISLAHYYMGHVEWIEGYIPASGKTSYSRTDLKLANTFSLDHYSELELSLIIQNLLDNEYMEFYHNNIFDRRAYLQLKLSF